MPMRSGGGQDVLTDNDSVKALLVKFNEMELKTCTASAFPVFEWVIMSVGRLAYFEPFVPTSQPRPLRRR